MSIPFPSDAWIKDLMTRLNESPGYQDAAAKWEGDFAFVVEAGEGVAKETYLYMDLWHGACRSARQLDDPGEESPEFTMKAPVSTWKEVMSGRLDPIMGLMRGKLALDGPKMKIIKAPKAALEMVKCAIAIDTAWPG